MRLQAKAYFSFIIYIIFLMNSALFSNEYLDSRIRSSSEGWRDIDLAKTYFHNSELQRKWAFYALGKAEIKSERLILDFGCGDGKVSADMSLLYPKAQIDAYDISDSMLYIARSNFPQKFFPNLQFIKNRGINLHDITKDEKYDLITSFSVFHTLEEPQEVIKSFSRLLKEEGRVIILYPALSDPTFIAAAKEAMEKFSINSESKSSFIGIRDPVEVKKMFEKEGFVVKKVEVVKTPHPFLDKESYKSWLKGTQVANWNIPTEKIDVVMDFIIDRHKSNNPFLVDHENHTYNFQVSRIVVEAFKPKVSSI
ncbi:MAG: class I SAM-dependent methyltransferase [Chlamydiales bacterium]|nr:class I SAM-dependent methyltransferase [Chlamydiales bacterium]